MDRPLVVNLFAGPGAGKSTLAAAVFALLKMQGVPAELVTEYAKDLTWEESYGLRRDQLHVFGEQQRRMHRLRNRGVEVIITDSPLLQSIVYDRDKALNFFPSLVLEVHRRYDNLNYFLRRVKAYQPIGRNNTEEGARRLDDAIEETLLAYGIPYTILDGTFASANIIAMRAAEQLGAGPLKHTISTFEL